MFRGPSVRIRNFQVGDESVQAEIYNEAAALLPKLKLVTADDIRRRSRSRDFDPAARFLAEVDGNVVGYCGFHSSGRISYPWCRPGFEKVRQPLFERAIQALIAGGYHSAFAAYRADWPEVAQFLLDKGFRHVRDMVNFIISEADMPTRPSVHRNPLTPLQARDISAVAQMGQGILRTRSEESLRRHLFHNPYFSAESLFAVRDRSGEEPVAAGILVADITYANPADLDADMPCFRLGAFGAEEVQTKRVNGLFSFLTREGAETGPLALDLMGQALDQFEDTVGGTLAAQVPSDALHLLRFYERYFKRQGAFPVFERRFGL
jgi:hypothetical protein